jgi:hypothetical protein
VLSAGLNVSSFEPKTQWKVSDEIIPPLVNETIVLTINSTLSFHRLRTQHACLFFAYTAV